jgi:hypothetical protein
MDFAEVVARDAGCYDWYGPDVEKLRALKARAVKFDGEIGEILVKLVEQIERVRI